MPDASQSAPGDTSLRLASALLAAWLLIVALSGIQPTDRSVWVLENILAAFFVGYLALTARSFPLSSLSYVLIFIFLFLHQLGAHYTYEDVPYDAVWQALTGDTLTYQLGWKRNYYDRFVHLCYGLLLAYPLREVMLRLAGVGGFWGYFLPLNLVMSTSLFYELIEWGAASYFGESMAVVLGAQGDRWDAHQDMLIAATGALAAMMISAIADASTRRWPTRKTVSG